MERLVSDLDLILAAIATLNTKVEWLVESNKYLLNNTSHPMIVLDDDGKVSVAPMYQSEGPVEEYENEPEPEPVVEQAPPSVQQTCTHGQQQKVGNDIVCARCGHVILAGTGIDGQASQHGV